MMTLTYSLMLVLAVIMMAFATAVLNKCDRKLRLGAVLGMAAFLFYASSSLPALASPHLAALGAEDSTLRPEQELFEETGLKPTPGGEQYSGLEYVKSNVGTSLSDAEIENRIKSNVRSDLVVSSAAGSVIVAGTVEDKETARNIVEQIKEIPGVHEVTFELGLLERSPSQQ